MVNVSISGNRKAERDYIIVNEDIRGIAFGMYNFAVGAGALPASIIFGFIYSWFNVKLPGFGGTIAFCFGGIIALISMLFLSIIVKEPLK